MCYFWVILFVKFIKCVVFSACLCTMQFTVTINFSSTECEQNEEMFAFDLAVR